MAFDYETNITAVKNNLLAHNTTTANPDLSSQLISRVKNIYVSNPDVVMVRWQELPAIYIRAQTGEEAAAGLGDTGPLSSNVMKFKEVLYEIIGMYPRDGAHTGNAAHETEMYRMAENIEGVFQRQFQLSGTALWCHPERTDFGAFQLGEGLAVSGMVISLRAKYMFR